MGRWIYVAGPYSKGDVAANVRMAVSAGMAIRRAGGVPILPHLFHFAHYVSPAPYEFWMSWDAALLERCDAILRLPGDSEGADVEVESAEARGIPVYRSISAAVQSCVREERA